MSELAVFVLGFFGGVVGTLALTQFHVRRICAELDEFLEDEIVAPLRKTDAPRAYRLQLVYRILLQRLERFI